MSNKKSGYAYLKEKVAKLETERAELVEQLHEARDMWDYANAKRVEVEQECLLAENKLERSEREVKFVKQMRDNICERYVWLWEHAPFWLKWWFHRKFNKQK